MMRILFATDGSPSANRAQDLLASLRLPDPTTIEVLSVDRVYDERDLPHEQLVELHRLLREDTDKEIAATQAALGGPGRTITTSVHFGRPASVIVEIAERSHADLIVVGSRGRGRFASALLGSVAAEVVDHAPCPVLVARGTSIDGVVIAADGSPGSRRAEVVAASLPFVNAVPVRVVSIAPSLPAWYASAEAAGAAAYSGEVYQRIIDDQRAEHERIAAEAANRLSAQGIATTVEVTEGDPAYTVIDAAANAKAGLIVVGSRGTTGLARFFVGSVARGILYHAPCSVLVVPETVAARTAAAVPAGRAG